MRNQRLMAEFYASPWAILPTKLAEIQAFLDVRAWDDDEPVRVRAARERADYQMVGRVAVVPVTGTLLPKVGPMDAMSGATSTAALGATIDRLTSDKAVRSIVLAIDSPGGSVFGIPELASKIQAARNEKKIIAAVDPMAASAAYWIASQASEIYMTPSGQVGSIGVITAHVDQSKLEENAGIKTTVVTSSPFKAEFDPSTPLAESARAELQAKVDQYHAMFIRDIAKGRGVSEGTVNSQFGQGRMKLAKDARAAGMVDGIATVEQVLRRLGAEGGSAGPSALAREAAARAAEIGV